MISRAEWDEGAVKLFAEAILSMRLSTADSYLAVDEVSEGRVRVDGRDVLEWVEARKATQAPDSAA